MSLKIYFYEKHKTKISMAQQLEYIIFGMLKEFDLFKKNNRIFG